MRIKILLLLCFISLLLSACGKKVWPNPQEQEDKVEVSIIKAEKKDKCYKVYIQIKGDKNNIRTILVQGENKDTSCPTCPFEANTEQSVFLEEEKGQFHVTYCPDMSLSRIRLVVKNVYKAINDFYSNVYKMEEN